MELSYTEENYIKSIYHISDHGQQEVSTNSISELLQTAPASVTDMLRRLSTKKLVHYKKYQGVKLSEDGKTVALKIIRKHRLWEVFLVNKLKFNWDEVHDVAEQLEHIKSPLLIRRLDEFLGYPTMDPHGDPIPSEEGVIKDIKKRVLEEMEAGSSGTVLGVDDSSSSFLKYLDKVGISIGSKIKVLDTIEFDNSMEIKINGEKEINISNAVSKNIYINEY